MARIILASGSPRRQELLQRMGLREFEISVPDVEEWYPPELVPEDIVAYISREKSQAVQAPADAIVITADTMVFLDDQRLGKPHDEAEALSMLTALSGRKHRVCTGVTVRQGEKALTRAQGVGAKLAQRIILELRDKVSDEDISMPFSDEIGTISTVAETIHNTAKSEAISALVALGYGQTDAAAVIAPMEDSLAVDELIRRALKSFTRGK